MRVEKCNQMTMSVCFLYFSVDQQMDGTARKIKIKEIFIVHRFEERLQYKMQNK